MKASVYSLQKITGFWVGVGDDFLLRAGMPLSAHTLTCTVIVLSVPHLVFPDTLSGFLTQ